MEGHPLHTSVRQKVRFISSLVVFFGCIGGLLAFYCYNNFLYALGEAGLVTAVFSDWFIIAGGCTIIYV